MDAVLRVESASAWFIRAAARYLAALGCGWIVAAGGGALAHAGELSGSTFLTDFDDLGLLLFGWLGVPSLLVLLLSAPTRESELHRLVVTFLWCGTPVLGFLYAGWWALTGLLFQIGCGVFLLPAPRLRIVRRPARR